MATRKNKKGRKAPRISATGVAEGTIQFGSDKEKWVVKKTHAGIHRWVPFHSTSLFGYAPLTAKILSEHIQKPITVFERESKYTWPTKPSDFDIKYTFTATGDADVQGNTITDWLHYKKPHVKKDDRFIIKGLMKSKNIDSTLQVAPLPGELVSTNLMNTDAFIKV